MFDCNQYELLDFGNGRKLERIGGILLDRPAPAAVGQQPSHPSLWSKADAIFSRDKIPSGRWKCSHGWPQNWAITHGRITLELKPTDVGHVGLFPEQMANWDWIAQQIERHNPSQKTPIKVLNLFAHTGGSTLAAAAAGAEVVHVDSAKTTVAWARRNAARSGLQDVPIRWIVEDATKFVKREVKRQNFYQAIILDPPSYGHGPHSEVWKLTQDLSTLLKLCNDLTPKQRCFFMLTCHSTGLGAAEVEALLSDTLFGSCQSGARAKRVYLETNDGRRLPSGVIGRWPSF